jgi:hypothetical protein
LKKRQEIPNSTNDFIVRHGGNVNGNISNPFHIEGAITEAQRRVVVEG